MTEERVFFDGGEVRITNSRFIVGKQTHAMNGVTSVQSHVVNPNRGGWFTGIAIGVLMLVFAEASGKIFGVLLAGFCAFMLSRQKATHSVILRSSSGETEALSSTDETFINSVVAALNDVIVYRG